ncbi:polysaccharide deacetylase family protein [Aeromicrobium sp. UC242_57]|uniref:polysaccharide deacetylase family protein n=1 Tax=Aeromicrobium sp. UC242_57 TaxID=3374624 RepID=UPI0037B136C8
MTLTLALVPGVLLAGPAQAAADDPPTVVSLTFDDGNSDQMAAAAIMKAHSMPGTFYVNSGSIGQSGFLTRAQLDALAADGHEIGGHTLNHTDLTTLPNDEAKRQICLDRANLIDWGFAPRSFAFPFAMTSTAIAQRPELRLQQRTQPGRHRVPVRLRGLRQGRVRPTCQSLRDQGSRPGR